MIYIYRPTYILCKSYYIFTTSRIIIWNVKFYVIFSPGTWDIIIFIYKVLGCKRCHIICYVESIKAFLPYHYTSLEYLNHTLQTTPTFIKPSIRQDTLLEAALLLYHYTQCRYDHNECMEHVTKKTGGQSAGRIASIQQRSNIDFPGR